MKTCMYVNPDFVSIESTLLILYLYCCTTSYTVLWTVNIDNNYILCNMHVSGMKMKLICLLFVPFRLLPSIFQP